jgi:hypothetical protein
MYLCSSSGEQPKAARCAIDSTVKRLVMGRKQGAHQAQKPRQTGADGNGNSQQRSPDNASEFAANEVVAEAQADQ